jgi:dipeptide/tripeptide permease
MSTPVETGLAEPQGVTSALPGPAGSFRSHPKGLWYLYGGGLMASFALTGVGVLLVPYLTQVFRLGEPLADRISFYFLAACILTMLPGGRLGDRLFGQYGAVVGFCVPCLVGLVLIGFPSVVAVLTGLALVTVGAGVIAPNLPTLVGLTYTRQCPGDATLRRGAFAVLYFAVVAGAALALFALPVLRDRTGYRVAFLLPAAGMALALALFVLGRGYYGQETVGTASAPPPGERARRAAEVRWAVGLFIPVTVFWAVVAQSAGTWVSFADTYTDLEVSDWLLPAAQMPLLTLVVVLILLPVVTLFWRVLGRWGYLIRPTTNIALGILLAAAGTGAMAAAGYQAGPVESGARLVLTRGSASLSACEIVLNTAVARVRNARAVVEEEGDLKGKVTVEGAQISSRGIPFPVVANALYTPAHSTAADEENNRITIKHGQIFIKDGVVRFSEGGAAVVKDGTVESVAGGLELKDGRALRRDGTTVLEPGRYTTDLHKVPIGWTVAAYLALALAATLVGVAGLQLAFDAAPRSLAGFVTGCWLAAAGLGAGVLSVPLARLYVRLQQPGNFFTRLTDVLPDGRLTNFIARDLAGNYFALLAVLLLAAAGAFIALAGRFNRTAAGPDEPAAGSPDSPGPDGGSPCPTSNAGS